MSNEQENINVNSDDSELSYTYNFNVPNVQPVNVTPSTESQQIYAPDGVSGYSPVNISGVNSNIDPNIIPENIKKDVTILGVTGNYSPSSEPAIEELNITPTTSEQTITASGGVDGYSPINISAVTSSIDSNIQPENIKKDVVILGTTGTFEGSGGIGPTREVSAQGVYQQPSASFTFSLPDDVTDIGDYALSYAFYKLSTLTSVDLNSLTTISGSYAMQNFATESTALTSADFSSLTTISGSYAMQSAFYKSSLTSLNLSSLTTISGDHGLYQTFAYCTSLTSVNLSSLTTVSGSSGMYNAFNECSNLSSVNLSSLTTVSGGISNCFMKCTSLTSVDLSSLTTVSGYMSGVFQGCTSLETVDLSSLSILNGTSSMQNTFNGCTRLSSLSFPALTSTSFGSYTNQFNNMLKNVIGCTVHFPSNLQSVIGSWSDVTAGFGGTNTTVLFDLPATA